MKAFFFLNHYLAGGNQAGIQSLHALDEMWSRYTEGHFKPYGDEVKDTRCAQQLTTLRQFSKWHKTAILLNGGDHAALTNLLEFIQTGCALSTTAPWHPTHSAASTKRVWITH